MPTLSKIIYNGVEIQKTAGLNPMTPVFFHFLLDGCSWTINVNFGAVQVMHKLDEIGEDEMVEGILQSAIGLTAVFSAMNSRTKHDFSDEPDLYQA